jgi:pimeloyl-ACP methyl ester carboxylesterase
MSTRRWLPALMTVVLIGAACKSAASSDRRPAIAHSPRGTSPGAGPLRVERLSGSEPPMFVLRGRDLGPGKLVFLHGMCGHGLGYAQSFQHAAARKGTLIAPQADVVCGEGPGAKWSRDVKALDARITDAFRRLGVEQPDRDITVLGMSQGATRAAALARAFPERYTRLVSMGAPTAVSTAGLEGLRAAVVMVGQRERKDLMLTSERALKRAGVPVRSLIIPDADHAGMGPTPEQTMATALDWLWENSRAPTNGR